MGVIDISPLIKYAVMVVAFVAFCVGLIAYGSHRKQLEWDAAVGVQAVEAAENVIKAAQNTARIESEFQKKLEAQKRRTRVVTKEVKVYVEGPSEKCVVSAEFERVFDRISGLHNASEDSVPTAPSAPRVPADVSDAPLTDAAILGAYQNAVIELYGLWDTYAALRDWTRTNYELSKEGSGR